MFGGLNQTQCTFILSRLFCYLMLVQALFASYCIHQTKSLCIRTMEACKVNQDAILFLITVFTESLSKQIIQVQISVIINRQLISMCIILALCRLLFAYLLVT